MRERTHFIQGIAISKYLSNVIYICIASQILDIITYHKYIYISYFVFQEGAIMDWALYTNIIYYYNNIKYDDLIEQVFFVKPIDKIFCLMQ